MATITHIAFWTLCFLCFSCRAQNTTTPIFTATEGSPIAMSCSPGNIASGDLNKDGKTDLVIACGETRSLMIFTGRGDGRFDRMGSNPLVFSNPPNEIVIGDMNRDGNPDLVVGSHDSYRVRILLNDGEANFDTAKSRSVTMKDGKDPHTHGLGIADLNGDGYTDLATANSSDHDVSIMLSNGSGIFQAAPGSPFPVSPAPYPLTIGDVNGDRHPDIVSTTSDRSKSVVTLLVGDGRGQFKRRDIPVRTTSPWYVAIGDINKDKVVDLVMTHTERSELTVLTGNGNGEFTEITGSPFNLGTNAWHVEICDVNGDANPDVLAAADNGVRVMLGDGTGQFAAAPGSPFPTGKGTWHLSVTDVNGDGRPDVVTSNLESKNVSVMLGSLNR